MDLGFEKAEMLIILLVKRLVDGKDVQGVHKLYLKVCICQIVFESRKHSFNVSVEIS